MSVVRADPPRLVVVGASAGGVEALRRLVANLPADLPCAIVVVLHIAATGTSVLPQILDREGVLTAAAAQDDEEVLPGRIYVAPPDKHVLIDGGRIVLSDGPRENGHRPAIDPAMRSAVDAYGAASCGVVLSGTRDDGTAGMAAIAAGGGATVVQDPAEAMYPAMPQSAMTHVAVDAVLPVADIARWLVRLTGGAPVGPAPAGDVHQHEPSLFAGGGANGNGTRFTCPDCGGVLWEADEAGVVQLRCSVGHKYSPESLVAEHGRELERALWTAMRALDDRSTLMQRMADRAKASGHEVSATRYAEQARESRAHAAVLHESMNRYAEDPQVSSGEAEVA